MLESFGFSELGESVYLAMMREPDAGVAELARRVGVEASAVEQALAELAELALLRGAVRGEPVPAEPLGMERGLETLRRLHQAEALLRAAQHTTSRAVLVGLIGDILQDADRVPAERRGELLGVDDVRHRVAQAMAGAGHEVLAVVPGGGQGRRSSTAGQPLDAELLGRGVRMRYICSAGRRHDAATLDYAGWLTRHGGEIRTVAAMPLQMIVVDGKTAVVSLDPSSATASAAVLHDVGVDLMAALFETMWESATPLRGSRAPEAVVLSELENEVLRFLAEGGTDEMIARRLGVSSRHIRRLANRLMQRLGARSRFEAGVKASQNGWLTS
ncbi:hypothetical protein GCM10009839_21670 [Catenulispora yoronensis]|uniref:HTH luxR-type domain-containing protein n=1 Tax=Catenulispora yoronensis TaxID=450799 RepID=A0ABN2TYI3_9ACTN